MVKLVPLDGQTRFKRKACRQSKRIFISYLQKKKYLQLVEYHPKKF